MLESVVQELAQKGAVTFYVRARPGAPRSEIRSRHDDGSLKIDIAAPAEGGKANVELISILAREFSVPKQAIEIVSGKTARMKLVRIRTS